MIEYTYPECTTACVTALSVFKKRYPNYRAEDVERVSLAAIKYIHGAQREDGSWYGSWGICFTFVSISISFILIDDGTDSVLII